MKNGDLPAMPIEFNGFGQFAPEAHAGLSKREMLAMAAMQGLIVACWKDVELYESASDLLKNIAESSVEHADALLAELEKTK